MVLLLLPHTSMLARRAGARPVHPILKLVKPPTTPRSARGTFVKGAPKPPNAGRAKGKRNRTTVMLKEAILTAAELCGQDGKGKDGMVGYLKMLAVKERALFTRLLEKVLPMQLNVEDKTVKTYSAEEAAQRLRERGLPVPPSLIELGAASIAYRLSEAAQSEDEADGE
jgi:hypothetical protein